MKISREAFQDEIRSVTERMHQLVFIGMSGTGKTHWARRVARAYGYKHADFDTMIGQSDELAILVENYSGKDMAEKMGNYFSMPWTDGFAEKEQSYLQIERDLMAKQYPAGSVLDLTGSSIYHPSEMERISKTGVVIYLQVGESMKERMLEIYLSDPKPVIWGEVYSPREGEQKEDALRRCYPLLLAYRTGEYERYADVVLPYEVHRKARTAEELLEAVAERL